ncbi:MAG TPA: potassium channel protein [Synergistales bacterium]|nr:potassium channel protein [Synergistales bacterium]
MDKRTRILLGILLVVLAGGFAGMHFIIGLPWSEAFYYTVITLSTVGYESPGDLGMTGQIFIVCLILTGLGTAGYIIGHFSQLLLGEKLTLILGKGGDKKVKDLEKHWIICGLGRYGMQVASLLLAEEIPFVAVELSEEKVTEARERGFLVVQGDARDEDVLKRSGIEKAQGTIVALDNEADIVYTTLTARSMNSDLRIVARASNNQVVNMLYKAGANKVVNPVLAGASSMVRASLQPTVVDFLELVNISRKLDLDFGTLTVHPASYMVGQTLSRAPIRSDYQTTVIAVIKPDGNIIHNPQGSYVIEAEDQLIIFGQRSNMARLREDVSCGSCTESIETDIITSEEALS